MFNLQHVMYMVVSSLITALLLVFAAVKVKDGEKKNLILKSSAIITVIIHYSNIWVEFFSNGGTATVDQSHILPVYPCNVVMWMLLIAAFMKNKNGIIFRLLSEFCFYAGIVCGVIGILLNANFDANPTLSDYNVLKGLLSHSTMLFGCLYMLVGKYIKIEVFNALSVTFGLSVFVVCGLLVNGLFDLFGMTSPDGMFLKSNPYFPVSPILLGGVAVIILFGALAVYELSFPKEQRWHNKLKKLLNKENTSEKEL